ncbi:MAG: GTPase ObgE [Acidobacteriota bacterium]
MFIDSAEIRVKAGDGGNGCVAFRREKFVPRGGPSGGDGGHGGSVWALADPSFTTLYHLRHQNVYRAESGEHGMGSNCHGKTGADAVVPLPLGSVVVDADSGERVADLVHAGEKVLLAGGGNGGWGNQHFANATRQTPRFAKPGLPGAERRLTIELKLLADVAIVGFPNAGKSTLIAAISAAKPKIADYPFTTLVPNLGVVKGHDHRTLVVADIPGLIEGAHRGAGLGIRFLKHVERCRLLCHLVDASASGDAESDVSVLENELRAFSEDVASRPRVIAASKCDAVSDPDRLASIHAAAKRRGLACFEISAATHRGLPELVGELFRVGARPVEALVSDEVAHRFPPPAAER